jgi:hypothetical protein
MSIKNKSGNKLPHSKAETLGEFRYGNLENPELQSPDPRVQRMMANLFQRFLG